MVELLEIASRSGWSMNRQGQCTQIKDKITKGQITKEDLKKFWKVVDSVCQTKLRELPELNDEVLRNLQRSFENIRKTLKGWHESADTVCFTTKVILMFNWGESPAFDSRVRKVLGISSPDIDDKRLLEELKRIALWIKSFESNSCIRLDEFVTAEMKRGENNSLRPVPLGRAFDMVSFELEGVRKGTGCAKR